MVADGDYTAVLDRLEGELAVLVLEQEGESIDELVVDASTLPEATPRTDAILEVTIEDGELLTATYLPEETERRRENAQRRFDRLSQRPPQSDDEET